MSESTKSIKSSQTWKPSNERDHQDTCDHSERVTSFGKWDVRDCSFNSWCLQTRSHYNILDNLSQFMKVLSNSKDIYNEEEIKKKILS